MTGEIRTPLEKQSVVPSSQVEKINYSVIVVDKFK